MLQESGSRKQGKAKGRKAIAQMMGKSQRQVCTREPHQDKEGIAIATDSAFSTKGERRSSDSTVISSK